MRPVLLMLALVCATPAATARAHDAPAERGRLVAAAPDAAALAQPATTSWCGDERATDDRRNEPPAREHRLRALYLLPADAPSQLADVAPEIQAGADGASELLERARGRALRFDRGTRCGARNIDITTVRLRLTAADIAAAAARGATFAVLSRELVARGVPLTRDDELYEPGTAGTVNHVAWLDAPAPPGTCGQATVVTDGRRSRRNASALGGKLAVVYRTQNGTGFCGPATILHEVLHLLGAVQDEAPHATGDGHCSDDPADLMCGGAAQPAGAPLLDAGSDDYWDPPAGAPLRWWTVNLSPFLCRRPSCRDDLTARAATRALRRAGKKPFRR